MIGEALLGAGREGQRVKMSIQGGRQEPVDTLDMFFACVRNSPTVAAVEAVDGVYSYEEMGALAFQLAGTIQHLTENPCPRVLVALSPSLHAYTAMLASLIAGGTFCPVELAAPEERNTAICRQFEPHVTLYENTQPGFLSVLPLTTPRIDVQKPLTTRSVFPTTNRDNVAYVVFTSGTSGRPKGVRISRRSFSHFLNVCQKYFGLSPGEKWGQWSSLAHDLGVMDVFMALTQCGTLVPLSEVERKFRPATAIRNKRISVWQSVPSALDLMRNCNQVTSDYLASLRVMSFCGEPLRRGQLQALFDACPELTVFNTYGTTETTGFNTLNRLTSENFVDSCELLSVAIGEDVVGWNIHLQGGDDDEEGEIVVASDFLSAGYWRDEEGTQSSFREVESAGSVTQRCYFTGDWGVRRRGRLYCSGRMDRQVKIHGERIELGEIDGRLREIGFADSYTVHMDGELHAFVQSTGPMNQEKTRISLQRSLSNNAIPHAFHALQSLPRNQSGKIDREALLREMDS